MKNKKKIGFRRRRRIGLALGSGGAKGFAHVGIIQGLEELGVEICAISGTSAGAIVGGWYAATKDISELARMIRLKEWQFSWRDISPRKAGALISTTKLERFLRKYIGTTAIEKLVVPFAAVSMDMATGREVHLKQGDLVRAMLASSAVPAVFPPVKWRNAGGKSSLLVDGGLLNPVPFNAARELGADVVIGVDLFHEAARNAPRYIENRQWRPWNFFKVVFYSFEVMQEQLTRVHMKKGDVMLTPRVGNVLATDFSRADEAIHAGRAAVRAMRDQILGL